MHVIIKDRLPDPYQTLEWCQMMFEERWDYDYTWPGTAFTFKFEDPADAVYFALKWP
jgi:hypothetical protein